MNTGKIITFNKVVGLKELFENKETFTDWKFLVEKKKIKVVIITPRHKRYVKTESEVNGIGCRSLFSLALENFNFLSKKYQSSFLFQYL